MNQKIAKAYVEKTNADEEGILQAAVGSSGATDRMNEIIDQDGWDLKNFKKNPILLWGHNMGFDSPRPPIGKVVKVWFEGDGKGKKMFFKPQFDLVDPFAALIYHKYLEGYLNAFSVGYMPLETDTSKEDMLIYRKQELLEISAVPVPANPEANVIRSLEESKIKPITWDNVYEAMKSNDMVDALTHLVEEKGTDVEMTVKPYPNEHSCRLEDPNKFSSFRRVNGDREHDGKKYDVIYGKLKGTTKWQEQAYRYNKDTWTAATAKAHCADHNGSFEASSEGAELDREMIKLLVRIVFEMKKLRKEVRNEKVLSLDQLTQALQILEKASTKINIPQKGGE